MISITESAVSGGKSLEDEMLDLFSEEGGLSHSKDFEYRPQQQEMAVRVARALERSDSLVVEAGTGVGKSLAYLAPAVRFATESGKKAIISTHTIQLQEQLIDKDIPIVKKVLGVPFHALLLKGRRNYVCPRRLKSAQGQGQDLFSGSEREELEALWEWCQETRDGSLSDLEFTPKPQVWSQVCSEPRLCTPKTCGGSGGCFYQEIRKRVAEADVIVMNHTLFFTLMASADEFYDSGDGFLFPNDFVIFDEAHSIENVAARQLGLSLSEYGFRSDVQRLYNPRTRKGLFQVLRDADGVRLTGELIEELEHFFRTCEGACRFGKYSREYRVRQPDFVENTVGASMIRLQKKVLELAERTGNEQTKLELEELGRRVGEGRLSMQTFLGQDLDAHVYWVEKAGAEGRSLSLNAAPVNVGERLREALFSRGHSCVMTSATLGVGDPGLRYYRNRVGAEDIDYACIGSPFDYPNQMRVFIVKSMPAPDQKGYAEALQKWIRHFLEKGRGRAFVLFTSYRLLREMAEAAEGFCKDRGYQLLIQGQGRPRNQLLDEFKRDTSSVLFGTDSFWTGVDVPGEALSNVIVTRLPFAVPDHPLIASRLEAIREDGGDPFAEYSLPEAILKLRQGVGRLIRAQSDSGCAVILDNRVLSKPYGKAFLGALPDAPVEIVE